MNYYVYDLRRQFEKFEAIFSDLKDAKEWADKKLGEHAYISPVSMNLPKTPKKRR